MKSNIYATSGDTRNKSHQEIQAVCHTREYHLCLKNNIYSIWGDTCNVLHIRNTTNRPHKNKRMNAIPWNIVYVWRKIHLSYEETQCIVCHIRKYKKYAHQEIQGIRNTRNCYVALTNIIYPTSGDTIDWTPHQEINNLRNTSRYTVYMP